MQKLPPELITYETLPHITGQDLKNLRIVDKRFRTLVDPVLAKHKQLKTLVISKIPGGYAAALSQITPPQKAKQITAIFKRAVQRALERDLTSDLINNHFDGLKIIHIEKNYNSRTGYYEGDESYLIATRDGSRVFEVDAQEWNHYQKLIPIAESSAFEESLDLLTLKELEALAAQN